MVQFVINFCRVIIKGNGWSEHSSVRLVDKNYREAVNHSRSEVSEFLGCGIGRRCNLEDNALYQRGTSKRLDPIHSSDSGRDNL